MKKQYVKPEIEVYDLEDVPMVSTKMPVAPLRLQSRQSSAEKSKTPTSNICPFSDK